MALKELPAALQREIEDLRRFDIQQSAVLDQVILTARVRSVAVVMYLDTTTYPAAPPRLELPPGWSWSRGENIDRRRRIHGLACQERWNRTLGLGALLRELEQLFLEEPPRKKRSRRREGPSLLAKLAGWIRDVLRRVAHLLARPFGRRREGSAAAVSDETSPEAVRARYDEVIRDKTVRLKRYREAVAQLIALKQQKTARLTELGRDIGELEERREAAVAASREVVEKQRAAGRSGAEIRRDVDYARSLEAFEEHSSELEEMRGEFAGLDAETDELAEKIDEHQEQLEALRREVEELQEESVEMVAELTTVGLEREIVDALSGISRAGAEEELDDLRRKLRKKKAVVRITREAADLDESEDDDTYLDIGRKVTAARDFEDQVGLGDGAPEQSREVE